MDMNVLKREVYFEMINSFLLSGYTICKYQEANNLKKAGAPYIIIRHDVDFSIPIAHALSLLEHQAGIKSTYFIHLRSSLYNPLGEKYTDLINQMNAMGHDVALHVNYQENLNELKDTVITQIETFKKYIPGLNTKIVSFHKPGIHASALVDFRLPNEISHTYNREYFVDISYYSDSGGTWKYGTPLAVTQAKTKKPVQILVHPLWWIVEGKSPIEKLEQYLFQNKSISIDLLEQTVISYSLNSIRLAPKRKYETH